MASIRASQVSDRQFVHVATYIMSYISCILAFIVVPRGYNFSLSSTDRQLPFDTFEGEHATPIVEILVP